MKWNWGTKLVLAMSAFMIMVIIFAVLMMKESINLVEKDYYPMGQAYEELINKKKNAVSIEDSIVFEKKNGLLLLQFPVFFEPDKIEGSVQLYHRSEEKNDVFFELRAVSNQYFEFPVEGLNGRYIVKLNWHYDGTSYYIEKSINLP
ncbi:MAG: hypothetical protein CVT92_07550 [Bacteroidetes bacterium HGW-Bacteroidetes-1]|jgi:nitrogen fixation protein FixH|nr:MAG: hypothetical protein CVT92_07550 [Bacteroidetes bacterium HGW-Bacteroidetes-1]